MATATQIGLGLDVLSICLDSLASTLVYIYIRSSVLCNLYGNYSLCKTHLKKEPNSICRKIFCVKSALVIIDYDIILNRVVFLISVVAFCFFREAFSSSIHSLYQLRGKRKNQL